MIIAILVVIVCLLLLNLAASALLLRSVGAQVGGRRLAPKMMLPDHIVALVGREVPDLEGAGLSGRLGGSSHSDDQASLIGFFSTGCEPCHARAPEFAVLAKRTANSLAVVTGRGADRAELVSLLERSSTVPAASDADKIARAFKIDAFPTFIRVEGGKITAAGLNTAQLS